MNTRTEAELNERTISQIAAEENLTDRESILTLAAEEVLLCAFEDEEYESECYDWLSKDDIMGRTVLDLAAEWDSFQRDAQTARQNAKI